MWGESEGRCEVRVRGGVRGVLRLVSSSLSALSSTETPICLLWVG